MRGSKPKLLPDKVYDEQIERMSGLPKFPALPNAKQELRYALRRISETDGDFLHRLISDVMDTFTSCPTPSDLIRVAGEKRQRAAQASQKFKSVPDCDLCGGSGWVSVTRLVHVSGLAPYEADFASPCQCRGKV